MDIHLGIFLHKLLQHPGKPVAGIVDGDAHPKCTGDLIFRGGGTDPDVVQGFGDGVDIGKDFFRHRCGKDALLGTKEERAAQLVFHILEPLRER